MPIRSILFPVVPAILVAAVAGCAVEPGAVDGESVQRAASAASVHDRLHVLVANSRGDNIVGYAEDGAPLGDFIPPGRGGLDDPDTMIIGPDHRLYVTSGAEPGTSAVLRFDAGTGAFLGVFASGHGLHRPYGLAFGGDGYSRDRSPPVPQGPPGSRPVPHPPAFTPVTSPTWIPTGALPTGLHPR